jgi:hypothetical protein
LRAVAAVYELIRGAFVAGHRCEGGEFQSIDIINKVIKCLACGEGTQGKAERQKS